MNRSFTDYNSSIIGARNSTSTPHHQLHNHNHHRRAHSFNAAVSKHLDHDNLDLFSRSRPTLSLTPSDHSLVPMKLGKISVGSVKLPARNALDDLLASTDGGKHDYDWLLTPPETPLCASSERSELQPSLVTPRFASRSTTTTKPSRNIRNGSGSLRPLPSTSHFPQSIRSAPSRNQAVHGSGSPTSVNSKSPSLSSNGSMVENGSFASGLHENGKKEEIGRTFGRLTTADMYESTRYDAILLKEDLKNTTWLHSVDDMSDQCSIFENGFEPLPEPFGLS